MSHWCKKHEFLDTRIGECPYCLLEERRPYFQIIPKGPFITPQLVRDIIARINKK